MSFFSSRRIYRLLVAPRFPGDRQKVVTRSLALSSPPPPLDNYAKTWGRWKTNSATPLIEWDARERPFARLCRLTNDLIKSIDGLEKRLTGPDAALFLLISAHLHSHIPTHYIIQGSTNTERKSTTLRPAFSIGRRWAALLESFYFIS